MHITSSMGPLADTVFLRRNRYISQITETLRFNNYNIDFYCNTNRNGILVIRVSSTKKKNLYTYAHNLYICAVFNLCTFHRSVCVCVCVRGVCERCEHESAMLLHPSALAALRFSSSLRVAVVGLHTGVCMYLRLGRFVCVCELFYFGRFWQRMHWGGKAHARTHLSQLCIACERTSITFHSRAFWRPWTPRVAGGWFRN